MRSSFRYVCRLMPLAALGLFTHCDPAESGLCEDFGSTVGEIDAAGDVYSVRVYNCASQDIFVTINKRNVGTVPAYNPDTNFCGVTDLGSFPQCTTGRLEAYAYNLRSSTVLWNESAVSLNGNGCWISSIFVEESHGIPENAELPAVEPTVTRDMLCQGLTSENFEESF